MTVQRVFSVKRDGNGSHIMQRRPCALNIGQLKWTGVRIKGEVYLHTSRLRLVQALISYGHDLLENVPYFLLPIGVVRASGRHVTAVREYRTRH